MTIVINTLRENSCNKQILSLLASDDSQIKIIDTNSLEIHHCIGCNVCWLKTPGQCEIKDDYKQIIQQLVGSNNLWLVTDTKFGFLDFHGKRVMDRIMPMLNMYIEFRGGWMRHQLRYHALNVGVIYQGNGNQKLLKSITSQLGCSYGGCLIKGGSFMYRLFEKEQVEKMTKPYLKMGHTYGWDGNFLSTDMKKITGPERYPWLVRQMVGLILKFVANKKYDKFAAEWGCTTPLDVKVYNHE